MRIFAFSRHNLYLFNKHNMRGIDPNKVKIIHDRVLLKLPTPTNGKITFKSGQSIYLDTSSEPARHVNVHAEVVKVCEKFSFRKGKPSNYDYQPQIEIVPGDEVIVDYFQILNHMGDLVHKHIESPKDMYIEWEGEYYVFVDYYELYAKRVKDVLVPLNGYVIYEGEYNERSWGERSTKVLSERRGKVKYVGKPNVAYADDRDIDAEGLKPGEKFWFTNKFYRKLEYDLHSKEGDLYVTQLRYCTVHEPI